MGVKNVSVRFYRANRVSSSKESEWSWPDHDDVAAALAAEFDEIAATEPTEPVEWFNNLHLIELVHSDPIHFVVSSIRRDDLPLVLRDGATSGTPLTIGERDSLLEPTYLRFYSNRIVAVIRNSRTPTPRAAAAVLARLTKIDPRLDPIIRPDTLSLINSGNAVSYVDLAFAAGSIDTAAEIQDTVKSAKETLATVPAAGVMGISFKAETAEDKYKMRSWLLGLINNRGLGGFSRAKAWVSGDAGTRG